MSAVRLGASLGSVGCVLGAASAPAVGRWTRIGGGLLWGRKLGISGYLLLARDLAGPGYDVRGFLLVQAMSPVNMALGGF